MVIVRVSYLGPEGSFSSIIARTLYPEAVGVPQPSITAAIRLVEAGSADLAVVPIENSIGGPVTETLMNLSRTLLKVGLAAIYRIELVAARGGDERVIYGHSHALSEAWEWVEGLEGYKVSTVSSTSEAAMLASREGGICLCSREAALKYGLEVIADNVSPRSNYTKFIVLGWKDNPSSNGRTMIIAVLKDTPGSLYRFLEPFAREDLNLTMIYSMPLGSGEWRYLFYIEVDGSRMDKRVERALREARRRSLFLTLLGTYPVIELNRDLGEGGTGDGYGSV